ncbi:BrnA antitoxin family protein [Patescibacteria group bacterium]|nr:BrnA antitoxin family protein [Patescibacteria group bacterium]
MTNNKIPKNFKSLKDEAEFWDRHDIGDFMGELKVVEGNYQPVDENKTTMTIRLTPSLKTKINKIASGYDISTSSLVRMWMVDRLRTFIK